MEPGHTGDFLIGDTVDTVIIGPLALPAGTFVVLVGFFAATLASLWWQRRGQRIEATLWLIAVTAVFGARLAFVLRYHNQYESWLAMLDIRDGGWWWPGVLLALPVLAVSLFRHTRVRAALLSTCAAAMLTMTVTLAALQALSPTPSPLPDVTLYNLEGETATLKSAANGVTLVNLWATWCPPCRREMPVLESAQQRYPDVRFILVNQGENPTQVRQYLTEEQLHFEYLLLDPHTDLGRYAGNRGLPLTLLFDNKGQEVARHFGPLSDASLHHFLNYNLSGDTL